MFRFILGLALISLSLSSSTPSACAKPEKTELLYFVSNPPLEVQFALKHYSGRVQGGNLFLQEDIPTPPVIRWTQARASKLYTLLMIDMDGNASGSWPDPVPPGSNAPIRHWVVGNIPGALLRSSGYEESKIYGDSAPSVLQHYRAPHIPVVSDRYGLYLFEQHKRVSFERLTGDITNFDYAGFRTQYQLDKTVASNYFVTVYVSNTPFSGQQFKGHDVTRIWHRDLGRGTLVHQE